MEPLFQRVLWLAITFTLLVAVFAAMARSYQKQNKALNSQKDNLLILRYPTFIKWIGFSFSAMIVFIMVLFVTDGLSKQWPVGYTIGAVIGVALFLFGFYLVVLAHTHHIIVEQNQIIRSYWLKKKRIISFDALACVTEEIASSGVCRLSFMSRDSAKPVLTVDSTFLGFNRLETLLVERKLLAKPVGMWKK